MIQMMVIINVQLVITTTMLLVTVFKIWDLNVDLELITTMKQILVVLILKTQEEVVGTECTMITS